MIVLDSSALVAIVAGEASAAELNEAIAQADGVIVPSPCLVESGMVLSSRLGPDGLALLDAFLSASGARVAPFTEQQARTAIAAFAQYGKGRHPAGLNFGDCMANAVAQAERASLLFTGEDFALTEVTVAAPARQ